jgi:hypothetical protein
VPFQLPAAPESTGPLGTRQECEVSLDGSAGSAYVLFAPKDSHGWVLIRGECSAPLPVVPGVDVPPRDRAIPARSVIVWQSWPPCFQRKLFAFQVPKAAMPAAGKIGTLRITPKDGASLLAVTQLVDKSREPHLAEVFAQGEAQCLAALAGEAKVTRFRMLVDGLPAGRIAILPDKELVGPVAKFLYATRLMKKCRRLTPEELLDAKLFNARNFPVLLNVGGENYAGSIHRDGDGVAAILNYLRSGGFLAMLTTQPLPFCYDGLDVSHKPRSLTPKMGFPIANQFETPPANAALRIGFLSDQDWLSGFPREIPFFNEGDLRLRSVEAGAVSRDAVYTPLVTVLGAGRSYGDIAAVAHFKSGPYRGAGLLFVWSRLLDDPQLGPPLIDAVMRKLLTLARGSGG